MYTSAIIAFVIVENFTFQEISNSISWVTFDTDDDLTDGAYIRGTKGTA